MKNTELLGMRYGKIIERIPITTPYLHGIKIAQKITTNKINKAILLIHGFSSTPAVFRHLIPFLSNYNLVVAPQLPGHSSSIEEFAKVTANQWLSCAQNAYIELLQNKNIKEIHILGLSMGGLIAQKLAQTKAPSELILLAPAFDLVLPIHGLSTVAKWLNLLGIKKIKNRAGNIRAKDQFEIAYSHLPIHAIMEVLDFIIKINVQKVSCPTHVFLGKHDTIVSSPKVMLRLEKNPNTKIMWLENSAHVLPLDNDRHYLGEYIDNLATR